jgi:ABC-type antimicrobial peptide transport system permease subunit
MDRFILDLRLALRRLRQNPAFSVVAVLTLALGIGANTAIFSIINAALLRRLPVARASEIVSINQKLAGSTVPALSYPNYRDIRDRNTVLSGLMAYRFLPASLGLPGNNQRLWGYLVTGNYFDVLGVGAARGRVLHPYDDLRPGGHPVAVLTWPCWQKRFGGDPAVMGRTVKINGMDFTILGVTPQGFFGTELFFAPDVFFPMMMQQQLEGGKGYLENRDTSNFFVAGRLKPGVSMARAEAGLNSVARGLAQQYPTTDDGMKIVLTPPGLAGNYIRGAVIGFAAALFGVSCLVLLVACTNLASMLTARAADRRKEIALRLAVGAARGALVRQLLTENLVIAILGGAGGALLALWITDALAGWRPPTDFPLVINAAPDGRVFLFALMVSVLTTLLFGLLPALQATRTNLVGALKNEAISERLRHWQLRDYMVATQVGLSAVLLVCSVLVVRSLQRALDAPIGYNPKGAVTASFDLNIQGYSEARGREFQRRLLDKVRSIPGIESAAIRRHGGRGYRGGGADAQETRRMAAHGPQRGLSQRGGERGEGSRRAEFLRAAGDRGFVPAGADAGSPGRAALQTAGVHEEFRHESGAVLAITLDPAMRLMFTHMENFQFRPRWLARAINAVLVGTIHSEDKHPISRVLMRLYEPVVAWALRWKWLVIAGAVALVAVTVPVYLRLGSEFMPPLDEGALLFMPTTLPGISIAEAQRLMQTEDRILMRFPEVLRVMGKAGRAETPTDPAPLSMMETIVLLKPKSQWRKNVSTDQLVNEMNEAVRIPGVSNAWTMPIKNRIDMLTTGIRTPVGIKIYGADLTRIEQLGRQIESALSPVRGTRNVFAERTAGGYFLDFDLSATSLRATASRWTTRRW